MTGSRLVVVLSKNNDERIISDTKSKHFSCVILHEQFIMVCFTLLNDLKLLSSILIQIQLTTMYVLNSFTVKCQS